MRITIYRHWGQPKPAWNRRHETGDEEERDWLKMLRPGSFWMAYHSCIISLPLNTWCSKWFKTTPYLAFYVFLGHIPNLVSFTSDINRKDPFTVERGYPTTLSSSYMISIHSRIVNYCCTTSLLGFWFFFLS